MMTPFRTQAAKLLQRFRKPRVTFSLILILVTLFVLGLFIPQKWSFESREQYGDWIAARPIIGPVLDFLGFTDIYTSPITLVFLTLFYINLLLVVANRVPLVIKKALLRDRDEATAFTLDDLKRSGRCRELIIAAGDQKEAGNRIRSFFQNRAWSLRQTETGDKTLAVRNRLSAVGFLLFHLSFLLCLTGGLTIYYTRFSGRIALTEGEAFEGNLGQFYLIDRRPRVLRELPSLSFRLEKAVYEYEERQPSRLEAVLSIRSDDTGTTERIGVNQPVERGAYTILAVNAGVSPLFIIREAKTGADRDGAWVRLDATEDQEDMFRFDILGDLDLYAKFFPDYVADHVPQHPQSRFSNQCPAG
jgi:cytochrome c biogenesis protein